MSLPFTQIRSYSGVSLCVALAAIFIGCAKVYVTPQGVQQPNPAQVAHALKAESLPPAQVAVRDFDFSPAAVTENKAPLHRTADLLRSSSADDRRVAIGRDAAAVISRQAAKRLAAIGLPATRIPSDSDAPLSDNSLLVTGQLLDVDEGNRLTRVAIGLGAGESRLDTEVHVFRVMNGEKAEVLTFTTHADSGKMPGILASMGVGELALGPINAIAAVEDAASSGQKIYSSQIEYLAAKTGDQVAGYLSQYSADHGWIPYSKAKPTKLVAG